MTTEQQAAPPSIPEALAFAGDRLTYLVGEAQQLLDYHDMLPEYLSEGIRTWAMAVQALNLL